jgi:Fe-S-cluster containining protein
MGDAPDDVAKQPWRTHIDSVERQMERGSLFTHTALSETAERVTEAETFLYGLIDVLVANKAIDQDALGRAAAAVRAELDQRGETTSPGVALRVDTEVPDDTFVPVNCAERMHVCHAVCCRLHFALSAAEIESGTLKWDLGRPYQIRQDATGICVHNDPESHGCTVYADRPSVCRRYSCANDERIWTDFENMQLNRAWIEENLHADGPRLAHAAMVRLPDPVLRPGAGS